MIRGQYQMTVVSCAAKLDSRTPRLYLPPSQRNAPVKPCEPMTPPPTAIVAFLESLTEDYDDT